VILLDAASSDANIRYRPSSAYDVDPTVGGSSYYGYTEMIQFYSKYRVHSSKIVVRFSNRDAEAHSVYILPITADPGANVSDPARYYMNPLAHKKVVGPYTATPTGVLKHSTTTRKMSGVTDMAEDTYVADVGANPVDNWFWFIGTRYLGSGSMTYGVAMDIEFETQIDFLDRKILTDPAYLATPPKVDPSTGPFPPPVPVYIVQAPAKMQ